jgi:septal ring factor EnvC (AmiA/AmiB activator)
VAFAGAYRGYGQIVIIEHPGGWTSLVTGLAQLDARVGDTLVAGSPLGTAGPGAPVVTLELRQNGKPVNPLEFVGPR